MTEKTIMIDGTFLAELLDQDLTETSLRIADQRNAGQHTQALHTEGQRQGLALARAYLTGLLRAAK